MKNNQANVDLIRTKEWSLEYMEITYPHRLGGLYELLYQKLTLADYQKQLSPLTYSEEIESEFLQLLLQLFKGHRKFHLHFFLPLILWGGNPSHETAITEKKQLFPRIVAEIRSFLRSTIIDGSINDEMFTSISDKLIDLISLLLEYIEERSNKEAEDQLLQRLKKKFAGIDTALESAGL